jgi:outer membrane protein
MRESRLRCRGCGSPTRRRLGLVAPRRVWLRRRQSGIRSPFLMLVLCLWMTISATATVRADTLAEAMASAYETNPTLLAARKQLAGVDEQVAQALSFWRPRADVVAGGGYIKDLSGEENSTRTANTQFSTTDGPTVVLSLEVRQPIYNFSNAPRVRQAEEQVRSGQARLTAVEQDVLIRAAMAYLDLFRAEASLRYSTDYEDALQKSLESTRRQFDLGLVRNSSIAQAESRLAAATAQRIQAEGVLASARSNYAQVIGKGANRVLMPDMPAGLPESADEVIEAATAYNPSLVAARYEERSAREGVDVIAGQKLPNFGVQGTLNPNAATVLGVMSMPLYNGLLDPQVRASKSLVGQRRLEMEAQRRQAEQLALSAWQDYRSALGRVASYEAQQRAARIAVEGTSREYNLGLRLVSDLLNNQLEYFRSQVDLVGAQRDLRIAGFQMLAAMGRLTAADLGLYVDGYDANRHYDRVRDRWWGTGPDLEASEGPPEDAQLKSR